MLEVCNLPFDFTEVTVKKLFQVSEETLDFGVLNC